MAFALYKRSTLIRLALTMAHLLGLGALSHAQSTSTWTERYLKEAPERWREYRSHTGRFQGTRDWTEYQLKGSERILLDSLRTVFKQQGDWTFSEMQERGPLPAKPVAKVVNSKYSFILEKQTQSSGWVVTELNAPLRQTKTLNPQRRKDSILDALCFLLIVEKSRLISDVVTDREFNLKEASPVQQDGRTFLRVTFSDETTRPTVLRSSLEGWVFLDPDHFWVVKSGQLSAKYKHGESGVFSIENTYKVSSAGVPIPTETILRKKELLRDETNALRSRETEGTTRFDLVEKDGVPEHEFSLSVFGLPEPKGLEIRRSASRWYLWFIALGVLSLAVGAYFRHRVRRRNSANAQLS